MEWQSSFSFLTLAIQGGKKSWGAGGNAFQNECLQKNKEQKQTPHYYGHEQMRNKNKGQNKEIGAGKRRAILF